MPWETLCRPGQFGSKRNERCAEYDSRYGSGNWRIRWVWGENLLGFESACGLYEKSYWEDSFRREDVWRKLIETASEVYDYDTTDITSQLDYMKQQGNANHIQDIAVRNVIARRGWRFKGKNLVQIRSHKTEFGYLFSPGKIPFFSPKDIEKPELTGWWDLCSVESFWQSNKILQVKALEFKME